METSAVKYTSCCIYLPLKANQKNLAKGEGGIKGGGAKTASLTNRMNWAVTKSSTEVWIMQKSYNRAQE